MQKKTKKLLDEHHILGRCTLNLPANCHIPFYPEQATAIMKSAIDKVAEMEGDFLGGVLHSAIGKFTGNPFTLDEKVILKQVFSKFADYAYKQNITLQKILLYTKKDKK